MPAGQREVQGWPDRCIRVEWGQSETEGDLRYSGLSRFEFMILGNSAGLVEVMIIEPKASRGDMRGVPHAPDRKRVMEKIKLLHGQWGKKARKAAEHIEGHLYSRLAAVELPRTPHNRLRTTNMVGRFNEDLKWKVRLVRTWPNAASWERVYVVLLMEQHEAWIGTTWLNMQGVPRD